MKRGFILVLAAALVAPRARADTLDACATASESGQALQRQGRLIDARQKLIYCSRAACPEVVRRDCDAWLTALEGILPSIVVVAHDEEGRDVVAVRVSLDKQLVDVSNGRAVPVDPGLHTLHVEAPGKVPVDQPLVIREGERARPVTVTLTPKDRPAPPPPPPPPPVVVAAPLPQPPQTSPFVYVLGTLAAVGLASFVVFEIKASSDATHLRDTCAPHCRQSDVDAVSASTVAANVSLVAAGVFAAGTFALFFLGKSAPKPAMATGLRF
jgi:hypothetical protein